MALTTDQLKKYWDTANVLRKNLDAAEYKHIVLGLIFLKYISDAFEELDAKLKAGTAGKLAGMVISIKDMICYKDHPVSASFSNISTAPAL